MAQLPPPTPPPPVPGGGGAVRPPVVTAAAVVLFVLAGLEILGGLALLLGGGFVATNSSSGLGGVFVVLGIIYLAVAGLAIYAGVLILKLVERGRIIGVVLAAIGLVLGLFALFGNPGYGIVGLAAWGFIMYALIQNRTLFTPQGI